MCIVHPLDVESPASFACAQGGCAACLDALLRRHEGLVHATLRRQWRGGEPYADLLQEGRIGLWRAIVGFDPHRGVAFSSYAVRAIERHIWRAVFLACREVKWQGVPYCPDGVYTYDASVDPLSIAEEALCWAQVCAVLYEMVARLPHPLRAVVVTMYGLDGAPPRTLTALGRCFGVSYEMVRVWRNEALCRLRMPVHSARLRVLCDQNSRQAYAHAQALNRTWFARGRRRNAR